MHRKNQIHLTIEMAISFHLAILHSYSDCDKDYPPKLEFYKKLQWRFFNLDLQSFKLPERDLFISHLLPKTFLGKGLFISHYPGRLAAVQHFTCQKCDRHLSSPQNLWGRRRLATVCAFANINSKVNFFFGVFFSSYFSIFQDLIFLGSFLAMRLVCCFCFMLWDFKQMPSLYCYFKS